MSFFWFFVVNLFFVVLYCFRLFIFLSLFFVVGVAWDIFWVLIWFLTVLSFLVCEFVFLWLWPENLFSVEVIFLDFLLLLFWLLYCIVILEELACFLFINIFLEWIDPYFIFNFGLEISTWAGSSWDLFIALYFIGFSGVDCTSQLFKGC